MAFITLLTICGFVAGLGVGSFVGRIPVPILIIAEPFCFIDIILFAYLLARALREEVNDENRGSGERQTKSKS